MNAALVARAQIARSSHLAMRWRYPIRKLRAVRIKPAQRQTAFCPSLQPASSAGKLQTLANHLMAHAITLTSKLGNGLLFSNMTATESLGRLFSCQLEAISKNIGIDLRSLLGT